MIYKSFCIGLVLRTVALVATSVLLAASIQATGYIATSVFLVLVVGLQIMALHRYIDATNRELARFFNALKFADVGQRFDYEQKGSGFEDLQAAFTKLLKEQQIKRSETEDKLHHLQTMIEQVPTPVLSVKASGKVHLWNKSARDLFAEHAINELLDSKHYGEEFFSALSHLDTKHKQLVPFTQSGQELQIQLASSKISHQGQSEFLVSLQDIGNALDKAQLQAWQDLVRVLTHEIMNSITPITSLAQTSIKLIDMHGQDNSNQEDLEDLQEAVGTIAKRCDNLSNFVSSYKQLSKLPAPRRSDVAIAPVFEEMETLFSQDLANQGIALMARVEPDSLSINLDAEMLEQMLINLIRNAKEATIPSLAREDIEHCVSLVAAVSHSGRPYIQVSDTGTGVPQEILHQIYLPFFTTKKGGTGVGLALVRQIMMTHQGYLKYETNEHGGACFSMVF